ncbi:MAG: hypothetical protein QXJ62_07710 [Nitrososphaeria archaeon]
MRLQEVSFKKQIDEFEIKHIAEMIHVRNDERQVTLEEQKMLG